MMRIRKILIRYYFLVHYQIPQTSFRSTIWQTVRRIIKEILGVKGLRVKVKVLFAERVKTLQYMYIAVCICNRMGPRAIKD